MVAEMFSRNMGTLSEKEQRKLAACRVGVVGLGGIGSPAFEVLVRLGVGKFVIVDSDKYGRTDMNRQLYAIENHLGMKKVDIAASKAWKINPGLEIEKHVIRLNDENAKVLRNCDVVVDGDERLTARTQGVS